MIWIERTLLGLSLSFDAMAVAVTLGLCADRVTLRQSLKLAFLFGFFQALMPLIGYGMGQGLKDRFQPYDHWLAFCLLFLIGGKMLWEGAESLRKPGAICCDVEADNPFAFSRLLLLAVATSIDALAAGFSLTVMELRIIPAVLLIGAITFSLSLLGALGGNRLGLRFRGRATVCGGVILIGIGAKILIEHLRLGI